MFCPIGQVYDSPGKWFPWQWIHEQFIHPHSMSMNPPCTLGVFPTKKLAHPLKALLVNHKDLVGVFIVRGIILWPRIIKIYNYYYHFFPCSLAIDTGGGGGLEPSALGWWGEFPTPVLTTTMLTTTVLNTTVLTTTVLTTTVLTTTGSPFSFFDLQKNIYFYILKELLVVFTTLYFHHNLSRG